LCFRQVLSFPTSLSSDGTLTVPTTPGAGKKKNQLKRARNERLTNIPAKNYILKIIMALQTLTVADELVLQRTIVNIDVIYIIFMLCTLISQLY